MLAKFDERPTGADHLLGRGSDQGFRGTAARDLLKLGECEKNKRVKNGRVVIIDLRVEYGRSDK